MRKNPHGRILRGKFKEQYISTVPKSCHFHNTSIFNCGGSQNNILLSYFDQ